MTGNQLAKETSPYLLLHADNPVHWRPWGPEALAEAEAENKPILLSVGYTACHWCHVMNEESFTDPETATLMNALFVNIKVDREERPDIDQLYQNAANTMGNSGGWPLTVFLTPRGEPFWAGTYFPREERFGQPSFKRVLEEVSRIYRDEQGPVAETIARVNEQLGTLWSRDHRGGELSPQLLDIASVHTGQRFDVFYGGLSGAPKFPNMGIAEMMWRAYLRTGAPQFQQVVQTTLENMSLAGIYDHAGGGFARYATDERWLIPHFEKMLYDNAQIVEFMTLVWQHNRHRLYQERIEETIAWLLRDMRVGDGFASSLDADSEGQEGRYYTWSEAEVDAALKGTFTQRFKETYRVLRDGNFEGRNILMRVGGPLYPGSDADEELFARQRQMLLAARMRREPPLRDDKVQTDWNGMAISALANAGAAFRHPEWTDAAVKAFDFVVKALGEGERLFHSWRDNKRQAPGFAEDYAQMIRAALALFEATQDRHYLRHARDWAHTLQEHFWDAQNGGYFTTADDSEALFYRARNAFDQATPSANGLMVGNLAKLFFLTYDATYRERCNALLQAFSREFDRTYISMSSFANGFDLAMSGIQIVIIGTKSAKTEEFVAAVMGRSLPNRALLVVDPAEKLPEGHPAYGKPMRDGQPTAYVCLGPQCSAPMTNPVQLSQFLQLPIKPKTQA